MNPWKASSLLVAAHVLFASSCAAAAEQHRVVFFGFFLINSSLEPTRPAEEERLQMLDALLLEKLGESGRFDFVAIPPDVHEQATAGHGIPDCNGCERDLAELSGADWAAWGTVQKVSNLILNINLYMENVRSGKMEFTHSVDIRGNTDESWRHGLDYMLRNYVLKAP
jgi:hypothetical protein